MNMAAHSTVLHFPANYNSGNLAISVGVVIFHLAIDRVLLCCDSRDHCWFLPNGLRSPLPISSLSWSGRNYTLTRLK